MADEQMMVSLLLLLMCSAGARQFYSKLKVCDHMTSLGVVNNGKLPRLHLHCIGLGASLIAQALEKSLPGLAHRLELTAQS
jgi:hypothetical protein